MKLPDYPMQGKSVEDTIVDIIDYLKAITIQSVQGGMKRESRAGTTLVFPNVSRPKIVPQLVVPFFPTLTGTDADGYNLTMHKGYVVVRKKKVPVSPEDAVENIEPDNLPDGSDLGGGVFNVLPVTTGDKITCKIDVDAEGLVTNAAIEKSTTWPESVAPELVGGDETTGTAGYYYIRMCEVIRETDTVELREWHTGHIDYFVPTLLENFDNSGSRVMKKFVADEAKWKFRTLIEGAGISLTENAESIEIASTAGSGIWGTFQWDFADSNNPSNSCNLLMTFENGLLTAANATATNQAGSGTQADPYVIDFYVLND